MWVRWWLALSVATVCSQITDTGASPDGAAFGWNWRLSPTSTADGSVAQYYVKLPQSDHQARYSADSAYQGVHDMLQAHSVALGQKLHELNNPTALNVNEPAQTNATQIPAPPSAQPVDIFLLQQQYTPYSQSGPVVHLPNTVQPTPNYYIGKYNTARQSKEFIHSERSDSKPLQKEEFSEDPSPVQVYKDHNCTDPTDHISMDLQKDLNKSKELFAEVPSYDFHDINNFATSVPQPYTYRGEVNFRVEAPRPNARHERYYFTTIETPTYVENTTLDGIDKLVASTQDLISNEDLLFINHAAEKHVHEQSEDIKPLSRYVYKNDAKPQRANNHITVKAKIGNIVNSNVHQVENDRSKQQVSQSNTNNYDFATPIVVSDNTYNNFREQIVDNLVSTMVPYMANGYQIVGVKDTVEQNPTNNENKDNVVVNVTPRPINQNYLAPITVALRLINSNDTDMFNTLDDHEASDSEFVEESVKSPTKEKTIVEVQKSIPVEITHINDVEVHEYIDFDEGRSHNKGTFDMAKTLYNKYVDAIKSSKKLHEDMNKILSQYSSSEDENLEKEEENDSDQLEPSENIRSSVKVNLNDNQRSEQVQYYENYGNQNQKIIQPIIIEKEVPITKFVDRFIEKKVPYPQHVEVKVPIDRPVAVPYEKIVERPVEITKYVDKPYPVEVPRPYPVEVKVPYPVEQKVYIDRPVHVPYPVEKVVEKQVLHPVPVPTPVGIPIEVPYPVEHKILYPIAVDRPVPVRVEVEKPVEKIVHKEVPVPYAVEKKVPYPVHYETRVPVPYPVEKRVPVPVERIVEKPVTVTKYIEKPIHIQVPVPQPVAVPVHVPQPYPVEKIVEKRVPYPVHVERVVEKPVQVPYPVEKVVEKIVEKPVIVTKYIDKPYPVEKKVPYPVEKIVEKKVPYAVRIPYPVEKIVERPVHIPVPYAYSHAEIHSETKNNPQYQSYNDEKQKNNAQQLYQISQYYQLLKEKEKLKQPAQRPVQTSKWGNQYASSYQYINNTSGSPPRDERKLSAYFSYLTNAQSKSNNYFGPVPPQQQDNWWESNKNYVVEVKMRRADREPKFSNLRIEYGGFKPPLIPSTEVDLDGMPINKET